MPLFDRIHEIASQADLQGEFHKPTNSYRLGFRLGEGRTQTVWVLYKGEQGDHHIVSILSPCLEINGKPGETISHGQALTLLSLHQQLPFARYGIAEIGGQLFLVSSVDHLVETLDPEEFLSSCSIVAQSADELEKSTGQDLF